MLTIGLRKLFFGYNVQPFRPHDPNAPSEAVAPSAFAAVVGTGNTLSGRSRPRPAASPGPSAAPSGEAKKEEATPFGGQGHSLTGKKPREVIEID